MRKNLFKVLAGLFIGVYIFSMNVPVEAKSEDTIIQGVFIDDIDVSGMTLTEAEQAVKQMVEKRLETPITLHCVNDNEVVVTPAELGATWNNPDVIKDAENVGKIGNVIQRYKFKKDLERENYVIKTTYSLNQEKINELIDTECVEYDQEAEDVSLQRTNGEFQIIGGQQGLRLDTEASKTMLYDFVLNEWDGKETIVKLPVLTEEPKGSVEELQMVKDLLGTYTTSYKTSTSDRVANVENGTRLTNGITLYPGETFSMLEMITPFTVENGYRMAGSYLNGMVVDSLGGGICQVSTTLYNAVLKAELEVTQRSNHSMSVAYVPLSADAAIAESAEKDFCFINSTDHPIYIEGITTPDRQVTFNIYGVETRSSGHTVDYISEVTETIVPETETIIQDVAQPIGYTKVQSAHVGYKARLIKVVYENGVEVSREVVNTSSYKMVPRTLTVGLSTQNQEWYDRVQAAIATGSIDQVCAVSAEIVAQNVPQNVSPAPAPEVPATDVPTIGTEIIPDI